MLFCLLFCESALLPRAGGWLQYVIMALPGLLIIYQESYTGPLADHISQKYETRSPK